MMVKLGYFVYFTSIVTYNEFLFVKITQNLLHSLMISDFLIVGKPVSLYTFFIFNEVEKYIYS